MNEKKRYNMTLIEKTADTLSEVEERYEKHIAKQTNPIMRKLVVFRQENLANFSVKDLFKK